MSRARCASMLRAMQSVRPRVINIVLPLVALLAVLAWTPLVDDLAREQTDAGFKRALASFALARTLDAVVSAAEGTELALQPAGVGMTFAPGEALEPIDDLVEQFAALMLSATLIFGAQKMLLEIGAFWVFAALLGVVAALWGWRLVRHGRAPRWLTLSLLALLLVRFAIPLVSIGSELAYRTFLAKTYQSGHDAISLSSREVETLATPPAEAASGSAAERAKRWWSSTTDQLDLRKRYDELKALAERSVEHIVEVIVVFMLQTLLFPLLMMWALLALARGLAASALRGPAGAT